MTTYPRTEMARIQGRLNDGINTIRNSGRYTEQGARTEMARLVREARTQRDELKNDYITQRAARRETLERILFGIPGEATPEQLMILRDSRDRAAKIDGPDDAATKLALAQKTGDTYMAQAIAMIAAHKGWNGIINTYADRAPAGTRASLDELAELPSGPRTGLADNVAFSLREPDELRHYRTDHDIDRLADNAAATA